MSIKNQNILSVGTKVIIKTLKGQRPTKAPQLEGKYAKIISIHPQGTSYQVLVDMGDKVVNTHVAMYRCHEVDYKGEIKYPHKDVKPAKPVQRKAKVQRSPKASNAPVVSLPRNEELPGDKTYAIVITSEQTSVLVKDGLSKDQVRDAVKEVLNQYDKAGTGIKARVMTEVEAYAVRKVIRKL